MNRNVKRKKNAISCKHHSFTILPRPLLAQIVPSILTLFSGLKRAYAARAAAENSDDDSDEEASDDDLEVEELGSDEDDIDEEGVEYIEKLQKTRQSMEAEDDEVSY